MQISISVNKEVQIIIDIDISINKENIENMSDVRNRILIPFTGRKNVKLGIRL